MATDEKVKAFIKKNVLRFLIKIPDDKYFFTCIR